MLFFSCSQSAPEVVKTDCAVIFSYDEEESVPEARLSVFLQSESDVRRCERIKVHSVEAKYLWETNKIKQIGSNDFQWAGNANFVVPEGDVFPEGKYEFTYINADDEQQVSYSDLKYDEKFYDMKADDVGEYMEGRGVRNIAIFDVSNVLIFFGEPSEDFSTTTDMLDRYNDASYYKDVWISYDNSVICILPKRQL